MEFPLVSVIVPCYNHERYVTQTLDSITNDSYPNKEIVIIDDGSTDCTDQTILAWINLNRNTVKILYRTRSNEGVCKTLNQLVEASHGKYIVPLASDDILVNNTLFERVALLEEHPEKLALLSDATVVGEHCEILFPSSINYHSAEKASFLSDQGILRQTLTNLAISGATVLIRRDAYKLTGPYPVDLTTEDWFFYQRLAAFNKILFYDRVVSLYRIHGNNTSNKHNHRIFRDIARTFKRNLFLFAGVRTKIFVIKQIAKFSLIAIKVRIKALYR